MLLFQKKDTSQSLASFCLPITTSAITREKDVSFLSFARKHFTYCRSKSPPCSMNFGITRWKIEFLYPKPFSPVHKARKFSISEANSSNHLYLLSPPTCSLRYNIIVQLNEKRKQMSIIIHSKHSFPLT